MGRVLRWVSAPVVRVWVASKSGEVDRLPRPRDTPEARSGAAGDSVLIFGGGPAVGWGVLSHDLALPGALSRALSRRSGRGAYVSVVPVPQLKIRSAIAELGETDLRPYDAIVVTVGVNDAGAMTSLAYWEHALSSVLRTIAHRLAPHARIFVAGVHPIRSIPIYDSWIGSVVDAHARKMNAISAHVCAQVPGATYVPLSAPEPCGALRFRNASSYRHWAEELADSIALGENPATIDA